MKALMTVNVLCAYPDYNKSFHIFTDAPDYQLGACIMHEDKPVAYYLKKLNSAQMNYATIDKELPCVVATLHKFRSMLLGAELHVHIDHKNILSIGDSSQQHLCWISYVDEYGPELHYVEGPHNVIADTFSRLLHSNVSSPLVGKKAAYVDSNSKSGNRNESSNSLLMDDRDITDCLMNLPCFPSRKKKEGRQKKHRKCSETISDEQNKPKLSSYTYDSKVEQCYLNLPKDMVEDNPLDLENIKERQDHDEKLMQSTVQYQEWYIRKTIKDVDDILCYIKPGDYPANWKIALPEDLIKPTIKWYHQVTGHPGSKRLYGQLRQRYYHRDLH
jgi:hypothetical protein